ncbi:hypothetical protein GCM10010358_48340 [Streptomyces minutiscleroticus]|uniref:DUF2752 domain-containing protein n=1 Tax=Streptomyces minutiscleroticus TaxID=68238 RepID=A0A918NRA2_9ACTN|nr:DUF2752 domain-containing protein [Streptomyces minutiscleroticus]GGX88717.1 hypothetical protein GCM10010358_48340 [Streptomyces minutiscleroticus]
MADAADAPGPARRRRRLSPRHPAAAPLAVLVAGAAGCAYLYVTDPHEPGHLLPQCPFRFVTGLLCPACGGTRMVYDLMHGHFAQAWLDNRMLLLASPFALALLGRWAVEGLRGRRWRPRPGSRAQAAILGTAVVWTVLRNLV